MKLVVRALLTIGLVVCIDANLSAQANWRTYCNQRFGQCADIPSNFKSDPPPVNGDGLIFRDQSGMTITVSARYNVSASTVNSEQEELLKTGKKPTYQTKGSNWFVFSGIEDNQLYYIREIVTPDLVATLTIEYPTAKQKIYDPVVSRVSRSFKITR